MRLSRMLSFRATEDMAAEVASIPDKSDFMRRALERALERRTPPGRTEAAEIEKS
jgi:hypothetical protein